MTTNHTELCERLLFDPETTDSDAIEAAYIIKEQAARIAELERERDALKADSARWREFAEHQTWCADCGESVSTCPIGSRLQKAAIQAEKETRS